MTDDLSRHPYTMHPDDLAIIINLCNLMNSAMHYEPLLEKIMAYCTDIMRVEGASILLHDQAHNKLVFHVSTGDKSEKLKKIFLGSNEGIAGWVFQHNEPVICNDLSTDSRFCSRVDKSSGFKTSSIIAVPLKLENKVIGVLELVNRWDNGGFSSRDLVLCEGIGAHIALALERVRLIRENIANSRLAAIGETVASLAHYIKNVLTALEGSAHLISAMLTDPVNNLAGITKYWSIIDRNINTMSSLVLEMLQFSKERHPAYRLSNINKLLLEVIDLYTEKAQAATVQIKVSFDDSLPEFYFDPDGIHRCLLNLISNSFDALNGIESPVITISSKKTKNEKVNISIEDNGCGMPAEIIEKITMSKFFSTKGSKGTGLGLPNTRKIIHEHNGTFEVASSLGTGTVFTITLPLLGEIPPVAS